MKANTISSRRAGLSSPSSACLSATLIERFEATASARTDASSISRQLDPRFGRQPLVELRVILELVDDRAHQRLCFGSVGRLLVDLLDLGGHDSRRAATRLTRRARFTPSTSTRTVPSGSFSSCIAVAIDAEVVERVAIGIVLARIELGDEEQFLVGGHRGLERGHRFLAADEQGERCGAGRRRCREAEGWEESESWTSIWAALPSRATKARNIGPALLALRRKGGRHGRGQGEDQHRARTRSRSTKPSPAPGRAFPMMLWLRAKGASQGAERRRG